MERVRIKSVRSQSHWEYFAPKQSQSGSLLSQNNQITVNETWEENLRTVNEIYLSTVVRGIYTFTQSQSEDLYAIAIQCPLAGGKAVFLARGLYEQYAHLSVNDIAVCFEGGYNLRQGANSEESHTVIIPDTQDYKLYPNPTSGECTLAITGKAEKGYLYLYNNIGIKVGEYSLSGEESQYSFSTASLPEGIYFCQVVQSKRITATLKLVIIK